MAQKFRILERTRGVTLKLSPDDSLLHGMERIPGQENQVIAVGCRSGGCGLCKVKMLSGDYRLGHMSSRFLSDAEREAGIGYACRIYPRSDGEIAFCGEPKPLPLL